MYRGEYSSERNLYLGGYSDHWAMEKHALSLDIYVNIYSNDYELIWYEYPQSEGLLETFVPERTTERAFLEK